jgi:hypothetical protein
MLIMYGSRITGAPANKNALNFIIITHYVNWYLHYIVRFRGEPAKLNPLLRHIVLFNTGMAAIYASLRLLGAPIGVLGPGLFEPSWYFSWTLLHYMVTFRPADLRNWVPAIART